MREPFQIPALSAALASGLLWLSGCASSTLPIAPLKKGESRHGVSLQSQVSSPLNYHYNAGLTDFLDLGFQGGIINAGASARLHFPTGRKTDWALTNALLAYRDPGRPWAGGSHYHLRWEGKLSLIRKTAWCDYALGPLLGAEIYLPRVEPDQPIGSAHRAGISLAIGGSRFGMEVDWVVIPDLPDWGHDEANFFQHERELSQDYQELALKLTWAWGSRFPKPSSRGRRLPAPAPSAGSASPLSPPGPVSPAPSQAPAPAPPALPAMDPLVIYGAAHCGADPEEFGLWLARDLDRLNLVQDALDAGKARLGKAGLSGGGGLVLFLLGGGIVVSSALQASSLGSDDDEDGDPPPAAMLRHEPGSGGVIVGGLLMAAGSGLTLKSLYHLAFDSAPERALTRAWESRIPEP